MTMQLLPKLPSLPFLLLLILLLLLLIIIIIIIHRKPFPISAFSLTPKTTTTTVTLCRQRTESGCVSFSMVSRSCLLSASLALA